VKRGGGSRGRRGGRRNDRNDRNDYPRDGVRKVSSESTLSPTRSERYADLRTLFRFRHLLLTPHDCFSESPQVIVAAEHTTLDASQGGSEKYIN
jgi:hypothetical protein